MEFKVKEVCKPCKGSGLYSGMAERDKTAIVCHKCKGTGCHEFKHEYEEFESRTDPKTNIHRVFEANPGIMIGNGDKIKTKDFGGMPYSDWKKGDPFPEKSEMREFTCPAWWYQSTNYDLKPNWSKCNSMGTFSSCKHFCDKSECWKQFDKEQESSI